GVGEREHSEWLGRPTQRRRQRGAAQAISLPMRQEPAKAPHPRLRTALQLGDGSQASEWLHCGQPCDTTWIVAHRLHDVAVALFDQAWIAPAKGEGDREIDSIGLHRGNQLLGGCPLSFWASVEVFK